MLEATWVYVVVPSGMLHSSPDMYPRNMCLAAASDEVADSVRTVPLAVELCGPLGCCGLATPNTTVAYASPTLGRAELPAALGN